MRNSDYDQQEPDEYCIQKHMGGRTLLFKEFALSGAEARRGDGRSTQAGNNAASCVLSQLIEGANSLKGCGNSC